MNISIYVIGKQGSGKSTLIEDLASEIQPNKNQKTKVENSTIVLDANNNYLFYDYPESATSYRVDEKVDKRAATEVFFYVIDPTQDIADQMKFFEAVEQNDSEPKNIVFIVSKKDLEQSEDKIKKEIETFKNNHSRNKVLSTTFVSASEQQGLTSVVSKLKKLSSSKEENEIQLELLEGENLGIQESSLRSKLRDVLSFFPCCPCRKPKYQMLEVEFLEMKK